MVAERTLVRIQENGQVTLSAGQRRRFGLKRGDLVAVEATPNGVLITPQEPVATLALAEMGAALQDQGLTLEEMIERGRAMRGHLFRERYGISDPDSASCCHR